MKLKNLTYENINITGGFWKEKQDMIRKTTIWNVYKRFAETGRFAAKKNRIPCACGTRCQDDKG